MARADGGDARVIVAANGGSDLIYVPDRNAGTVRQVVSLLLALDYVDGVFVDDQFGEIPGTLPLSAIDLVGSSRVPRPAIIVAFASFRQRTGDWLSAVQVSDTDLQHGQGMHGGFGRDSTFNNMAAIGPDFKKRFVALTPVSNADITPTIAHVLGLAMPRNGRLVGRAALEALKNGPKVLQPPFKYLRSAPVGGRQTVVVYREVDGVRYLYAGCLAPVAVIDAEACR